MTAHGKQQFWVSTYVCQHMDCQHIYSARMLGEYTICYNVVKILLQMPLYEYIPTFDDYTIYGNLWPICICYMLIQHFVYSELKWTLIINKCFMCRSCVSYKCVAIKTVIPSRSISHTIEKAINTCALQIFCHLGVNQCVFFCRGFERQNSFCICAIALPCRPS